jgi:hypothetical protein
VRFTSDVGPAAGIQWNGAGYAGQPSRTVGGTNQGDTPARLRVSFARPVRARGLDLLAFAGFPDMAALTVFAPDGETSLVRAPGIAVPSPAAPVFFGCASPGGVGSIEVSGQYPFTPVIKNLYFAAAGAAAEPDPYEGARERRCCPAAFE